MARLEILLFLGAIAFVPACFSVRVLPTSYPTVEDTSGLQACPSQQTQQSTTSSISAGLDDIITNRLVSAVQCDLGTCEANPAQSCDQVYQETSVRSGYYWLQRCDGTAFNAYCAMENPCGCSGGSGAWLRVGFLNMTNTSVQCPHGMSLVQNPRSCSRNVQPGACASIWSSSNLFEYSRVCGRATGYQESSPDAFSPYNSNRQYTIDDPYFDGASITYGFSPRKHIWTFAAGVHDNGNNAAFCPCSQPDSYTGVIPPFIGNDWFCEAGAGLSWQRGTIYSSNPLWDGMGCQGPQSTCCTHNNPPWFCKSLPESTMANIEVRLCGDQAQPDEDVLISIFEIYVQ